MRKIIGALIAAGILAVLGLTGAGAASAAPNPSQAAKNSYYTQVRNNYYAQTHRTVFYNNQALLDAGIGSNYVRSNLRYTRAQAIVFLNQHYTANDNTLSTIEVDAAQRWL